MNRDVPRNPSFIPSPKFREYLNNTPDGVTKSLNEMFNRYNMIMELSAARLSIEAQEAIKRHLDGIVIDEATILSMPLDATQMDNEELHEAFANASFARVLATLNRYGLLNNTENR